jgi:RNA polymerase sigma factor (sigma-70 family)
LEVASPALNPEQQLLAKAEMARLLQVLSPRERELIEAHYGKGMRFKELGAEQKISKGRVSNTHARALKKMREHEREESERERSY